MKPALRHIRPVRGAALVELALCLPVLLLFAMVALDLSQLAAASMAVGDASAAGARAGALSIEAGDGNAAAKLAAVDAARRAAPSIPEEKLAVSAKAGAADLGAQAEVAEPFERHAAAADGSMSTKVASVSRTKVECSASCRVTPKTPIGTAIFAAAGDASGMTFSSVSAEWAEALS